MVSCIPFIISILHNTIWGKYLFYILNLITTIKKNSSNPTTCLCDMFSTDVLFCKFCEVKVTPRKKCCFLLFTGVLEKANYNTIFKLFG